MNAHLIVLGAHGFLGRAIVKIARSQGIPTTAVVRPGGPPAPQVFATDLAKPAERERLMTTLRPTHIINAAAAGVNPFLPLTFQEISNINTEAPLHLYELAQQSGTAHFVQLGSCFEYGDCEENITELTALNPKTDYARTKSIASEQLLTKSSQPGCHLSVLRLFGIWGFGEAAHRLVPQIRHGARLGKPIPLSSGRQIRDMTYVDDMADLILAVMQRPQPNEPVFNLGSGVGRSIFDFATEVAEHLQCQPLLRFGELPDRPGEASRLVADISKLKSINIHPHLRTIAEGLATITANEMT